MGGCISSHASAKETSKLILRVLAEVNSLPEDVEPPQWKRLFHSLVPVTLRCTEDGETYVYQVSASGVDGSSFFATIRVPGTQLHKTSSSFIQWQEEGEGGGVWGLNFMSEEDAMKFLKGCSPPTLTPQSKQLRYSLPSPPHQVTPPPPPPADHAPHLHHLSDSFESLESETHFEYDLEPHSAIPGSDSVQQHQTQFSASAISGDPDTAIQPYGDTPGTSPPEEALEDGSNYEGREGVGTERGHGEEEGEGGEEKRGGGGGVGGQGERMEMEVNAEGEVEGQNMALGVSGSRGKEESREEGVNSDLVDVEGDHEEEGEEQDSDTPALFRPSSPLNLMPTGILHDIAEESEVDTELEHSWNTGEKGLMDAVKTGLMELEGVEYAETSFLDEGSFTSLTDPPPSLPLSPPPGPVLSPRLSMLLSDAGGAGSLPSDLSPSPVAASDRYDLTNRLSVLSTSNEAPPPLPTTLPPGKLISPRHSMLMGPEAVPSGMGTGLDFALLSKQIDKVLEGRTEGEGRGTEEGREDGARAAGGREGGTDEERVKGQVSLESSSLVHDGPAQNEDMKHPEQNRDTEQAELNEDNEEPLLITTIDEVDEDLPPSKEAIEVTPPPEEAIEPLPPPTDSADEGTPQPQRKGTKLKFTPSFLRSLEPPREFSDSGLPDTDPESALASHDQAGTAGSFLLLPHHKDGSLSNSDERMTEHSGSVGMKTCASSENAPSLTTQDGEADDSSTPTEVGEEGGVRREERGRAGGSGDRAPTDVKPTTRKTGWLEMKTMLVRKNRKVAMKSKRRWRRYWATLKGSSLLFSLCEETSSVPEDMPVDTKLDLSLSLAHAVHDHIKRDYIFCLSTANGNTYYLQTTSVSEMEDWLSSIHCAAAAAMTGQSNKEAAIKTLRGEVEELNATIEKENQLRNLTELNLSAVSDYSARSMASKQLVACTENIERYSVEIYRLRCYIASLQGTELPNPQTLLASISKPTKLALGKVGVFSVASLHAIVSARGLPSSTSSSTYSSFRFGRGGKYTPSSSTSSPSKGKGPKVKLLSRTPERASKTSLRSLEISGPYPILPPSTLQTLKAQSDMEDTTDTEFLPNPPSISSSTDSAVTVLHVVTPGNHIVPVVLQNDMTVRNVLYYCCRKRHLNPKYHFLRLRQEREGGDFECEVPDLQEFLQDQDYTLVEVCEKATRTVILSQPETEHSTASFGLILEPEWDNDGNGLGAVLVGKVEEGGVADQHGVSEGDEVVLVNDRGVADMGWERVKRALRSPTVSLTLRTSHIEMPISDVTNQIMESLICPAPPTSHTELSSEMINDLIVPNPSKVEELSEYSKRSSGVFPDLTREQIDSLLRDSHELSKLLRSWDMQRAKEEPPPVWTMEDRLRKSAQDLVGTEREYVKLLHTLVERYLEPLHSEKFISPADMEVLEGNIPEILEFQNKFLQGLEDALKLEVKPSQVSPGESPLKHVVFGIAGTFLYHMEGFRMYSTFCSSHYKIKQLLQHPTGEGTCSDSELSQFLEARNPRNDHTLSLPSLLAKPIVRVSRYPLFLNAMVDNTHPDSDERLHLQDAVEAMTRVANYINEVQRVSETYSALFDTILKESGVAEHGVSLSIPQLRYHGQVMWLNPPEDQRGSKTWKKGQGPPTLCFVFSSAIVLMCMDKKLKRRASKTVQVVVTPEDTKFRVLLPCTQCSVHDLPDSDGVTHMWQLRYKSKPSSSSSVSYLLRSQSIEQKSTMVHLIRQSIHHQLHPYGGGRDSPQLSSSPSPQSSPSRAHTTAHSHPHQVTSPLHLMTTAATQVASEHDHN